MTVVGHAALTFADLPGRAAADPLAGLAADASVRIVKVRRVPGRRAHLHPRSDEIIYVVSGRGRVWVDGAMRRVTAGDTVHIARSTVHATVPDHGEEMLLVCFFAEPDLASNMVETTAVIAPDADGPTGPVATTAAGPTDVVETGAAAAEADGRAGTSPATTQEPMA